MKLDVVHDQAHALLVRVRCWPQYYAQRENHGDLVCVSLSDPEGLKQLGVGDFVIVARGRRYFSNDHLISSLASTAKPDFQMFLGRVPSGRCLRCN